VNPSKESTRKKLNAPEEKVKQEMDLENRMSSSELDLWPFDERDPTSDSPRVDFPTGGAGDASGGGGGEIVPTQSEKKHSHHHSLSPGNSNEIKVTHPVAVNVSFVTSRESTRETDPDFRTHRSEP
jgi:hypothetical protein